MNNQEDHRRILRQILRKSLYTVRVPPSACPRGLSKGARISFGTDAGGFAWSVNQAKEFSYMVKYGMTPLQAIQSATTVAAELLSQTQNLGAIEPGKFADIIAVAGDPLQNISELERVHFVMKGGQVYKQLATPVAAP